jgi:hypothetical protein
MQSHHVSADDVVNAISAQNLVLPAGTEKIGKFEWNVTLNASPTIVDRLNELPVKKVDGTVIYVRDVAYAHAGSPPHRLKGKSEQVVAIEIKCFLLSRLYFLTVIMGDFGLLSGSWHRAYSDWDRRQFYVASDIKAVGGGAGLCRGLVREGRLRDARYS